MGEIKYNEGFRFIAKLCLNSLWGKFGQKQNMRVEKYITDVAEFYKILLDDKKNIQNVYFPTDNMCYISWFLDDGFVKYSTKTNIHIAAFTTSHARLRLYEMLEYIDRKVLYFDTDSVIYIDDNQLAVPIGEMMGDWADELPDDYIMGTFASGGPKNYSYVTRRGKEKCVIKGFRLNYENGVQLNHKEMLSVIDSETAIIINNDKFKIDGKKKTITTIAQEKTYRFKYDKRALDRIGNDIDTLAYGY